MINTRARDSTFAQKPRSSAYKVEEAESRCRAFYMQLRKEDVYNIFFNIVNIVMYT